MTTDRTLIEKHKAVLQACGIDPTNIRYISLSVSGVLVVMTDKRQPHLIRFSSRECETHFKHPIDWVYHNRLQDTYIGASGRKLITFDADSGHIINEFLIAKDASKGDLRLTVSPDGKRLLVQSHVSDLSSNPVVDGYSQLFGLDAPRGRVLRLPASMLDEASSVVARASNNGALRQQTHRDVDGRSMEISPDGVLAAISTRREITIINRRSGGIVSKIDIQSQHFHGATFVRFAPGDALLVTGSIMGDEGVGGWERADSNVVVWDVTTGRLLAKLEGPKRLLAHFGGAYWSTSGRGVFLFREVEVDRIVRDSIFYWELDPVVFLRGRELRSELCDKRFFGTTVREFSQLEMYDPVLSGRSELADSCARRGLF